jgi:glycosyltransferase involved in cell wall biosynthesis
MIKRHLVVSAVNLVEGGTLEILRQCLAEAAKLRSRGWRVTAIVNSAATVGVDGIHYLERPDVKPSWFKRIRFEYLECRRLAQKLKPDFWLSLHDMTPDLGRLASSVPQAVYCHNAMCFYSITPREMLLDPKQLLFIKLYAFFYRVHLKRNTAVIVQQDWIRQSFRKRFGVSNVIVAHPLPEVSNNAAHKRAGARFFYPSFPRVFKNFETVLAAWEILCQDPRWDGELTLTIDSHANRYQRWLTRAFGHLRQVRLIGRVSHTEVKALYKQQDCLVFASKLETWGLPLTEAKHEGLTILAADLPYAREAIGDYDGATFFRSQDATALAGMMKAFRYGQLQDVQATQPPIQAPFAANWQALLQQLLSPIEGRPVQDERNPGSFISA